MKARPLKDWIFFAFIALGILCCLLLPVTVGTYLELAENGYGLKAEVTEARLSNNNLVVTVEFTNDAKLDLQVFHSVLTITGGTAPINGSQYQALYDIERLDSETVNFIFLLDETNYNLASAGSIGYTLGFDVYVPIRDAMTGLEISGTMGVV